jgi:hypothetical protein
MMTKPLHIIHPIDFGIFGGRVSFACGYSIKQLHAFYKKEDCNDWAGGLRGVYMPDSCRGIAMQRKYKGKWLWYLILKDPFGFTDEEFITLAHECIHLVQFRLKDVLDRDREYECEAYLHSHLMSQCLKALRG